MNDTPLAPRLMMAGSTRRYVICMVLEETAPGVLRAPFDQRYDVHDLVQRIEARMVDGLVSLLQQRALRDAIANEENAFDWLDSHEIEPEDPCDTGPAGGGQSKTPPRLWQDPASGDWHILIRYRYINGGIAPVTELNGRDRIDASEDVAAIEDNVVQGVGMALVASARAEGRDELAQWLERNMPTRDEVNAHSPRLDTGSRPPVFPSSDPKWRDGFPRPR